LDNKPYTDVPLYVVRSIYQGNWMKHFMS